MSETERAFHAVSAELVGAQIRIATLQATVERQAAEIERLRHERRCLISHGIGGYTKAVDSMNLNDACVAISAFRSNLYEAGIEDERKRALRAQVQP